MIQAHKGALPILTLTAAIALGASAMAADLPKEGTFSGILANVGTYKAYPVGKEHFLITWDESGITVGQGFYDRMTWHCFGLSDIVSGVQQGQGRCIGTDPAGDQIALEAEAKPHSADAKTYEGDNQIHHRHGEVYRYHLDTTLTCSADDTAPRCTSAASLSALSHGR